MDKNVITRRERGKKYVYFMKGTPIRDPRILQEINKIYIAPAYTDVKIYLKNRKYKATGVDVAGRTQYIYNADSIKERETKKKNMLKKMFQHIHKLRVKIEKDIRGPDENLDKWVALVIKIMDICNFRIGSQKYEKKHGSYGITTLHKKHITFLPSNKTRIDFIGKKGVRNTCVINDSFVRRLLQKALKLSAKDSYIFSMHVKGANVRVTPADVNAYLKQFHITAKDLRTWNANILFLKELQTTGKIREAIQKTAILLHHTPAICKKSYLFKNMIQALETNESLFQRVKNSTNQEKTLASFF